MAVDFPRPVVHGGTGKRQRENTGKNLLDFSASLNPLPPRFAWHLRSRRAFHRTRIMNTTRLKECIAQTFHRDTDEICVGNGSIELIRVFCSVGSLGKKDLLYRISYVWGICALRPTCRCHRQQAARKPRAVSFVCNPNNPTGELRTRSDMLARVRVASSHGGILFVDEAFIELADPGQSLVDVTR